MQILEVRHPLIRHKLGLLRDVTKNTKEVRELTREIAALLTYEATADLALVHDSVEGWAGELEIEQLQGKKVTVVPILRAGLGMMEGVLDMIPSARVSMVGISRDAETLLPVPYFQKLVNAMDERLALVVDPLLATGACLVAALDLLKKAGCRNIRVLVITAAPEGIRALEKHHPDIQLYIASIDQGLDEHGYIIPGIGDAGDKLFGTR